MRKHYTVTIGEIVEGFEWKDESRAVTGMGGKLVLRPSFQREYLFTDPKKQEAIIQSVMADVPLQNVSFFKDKEGRLLVVDGQQRLTTLCWFYADKFNYKGDIFRNLTKDEKETFLNFEILVEERSNISENDVYEWYKLINKERFAMKEQEIRNAFMDCDWLTDARAYFSKTKCKAIDIGKGWLKTSNANRQVILERVLKWKSKGHIMDYMKECKDHTNASELINYYESVMSWCKRIFSIEAVEDKVKCDVDWGFLYNKHEDTSHIDLKELNKTIVELLKSPDIQPRCRKHIYEYAFSGDDSLLLGRKFKDADIKRKYQEQDGKCAKTGKEFLLCELHADHVKPVSKGGLTTYDNLQLLCADANQKKYNKIH